MGNNGPPVTIGIIIGAAIMGVLVFAGLIVAGLIVGIFLPA